MKGCWACASAFENGLVCKNCGKISKSIFWAVPAGFLIFTGLSFGVFNMFGDNSLIAYLIFSVLWSVFLWKGILEPAWFRARSKKEQEAPVENNIEEKQKITAEEASQEQEDDAIMKGIEIESLIDEIDTSMTAFHSTGIDHLKLSNSEQISVNLHKIRTILKESGHVRIIKAAVEAYTESIRRSENNLRGTLMPHSGYDLEGIASIIYDELNRFGDNWVESILDMHLSAVKRDNYLMEDVLVNLMLIDGSDALAGRLKEIAAGTGPHLIGSDIVVQEALSEQRYYTSGNWRDFRYENKNETQKH